MVFERSHGTVCDGGNLMEIQGTYSIIEGEAIALLEAVKEMEHRG
ncbi:hypothetical protein A2U01_0098206, partial [Trifolium medium]|nr:hypothetical protein [Trifolium medium]